MFVEFKPEIDLNFRASDLRNCDFRGPGSDWLELAAGLYLFWSYKTESYIEKKQNGVPIFYDGTDYGGFRLDPGQGILVRVEQDDVIAIVVSAGGRLNWAQRAA